MKNQSGKNLSNTQKELVDNLHQKAIIFDALQYSIPDDDYLNMLESVGVNAVHYTVAANSFSHGTLLEDNFVMTCKKIGRWYNLLKEFSDRIELATSIKDMNRINKGGKIAIFFGFQQGSPIEDNEDYLDIFKQLGVSIIMLTYNSRNMIGSGCGESVDTGLSDFGYKVIKKMNKIGMVVDLSHCGHITTMDAIEASKDPVVFTHANAKSWADEHRNKSDEQIKALAKKGGVICIKAILGNMMHKNAEEATVVDVVDHIDHLIHLVGIDHVGIGTDFRGTTKNFKVFDEHIKVIKKRWQNAYPGKRVMPEGFGSIIDLPNITGEMLKRGYSNGNIKSILGENFSRVLEQVIE